MSWLILFLILCFSIKHTTLKTMCIMRKNVKQALTKNTQLIFVKILVTVNQKIKMNNPLIQPPLWLQLGVFLKDILAIIEESGSDWQIFYLHVILIKI